MHFLIQVYRMELKPESLIHLVLKTLYECPYFLSFQENHWDFHVNLYLAEFNLQMQQNSD